MSNYILIVTANDNETNAFLKGKGLTILQDDVMGSKKKDINNYRICKYYNYDIVQFQLNVQGSVKSGASTLSINLAIEEFSPCAVILFGICFGKHERDHRIGDVVISERIIDYESIKVGRRSNRRDNSVPDAGEKLLSACRNAASKWKHMVDKKQASVLFGNIMSGDKLINKKLFRDNIPTGDFYVLGGEMEARGLYSACKSNEISEWIVIKAICDWGFNKDNNKERRQRLAAASATSFIDTLFKTELLKRITERFDEAKKTNNANLGEAKANKPEKDNKPVNIKESNKLNSDNKNAKKSSDKTEDTSIISVSELKTHQSKYLDGFYSDFKNVDRKKLAEEIVGFFLKEEKENPEYVSLDYLYDTINRHASFKPGAKIVVRGLQGTGKSTLISLLYKKFMDDYEENSIFPFIIDLHASPKPNATNVRKDLQEIDNFSKNKNLKYVFFIDGVDEKLLESNNACEQELLNFINSHKKMTFVFCVTQVVKDDESYKMGVESDLCDCYSRASCCFGMHRVQIRGNNNLNEVINTLDDYLKKSRYENKADNVVCLLKKYTLRKIDFRTILILLRAEHIDEKNLGMILYEHYSKKTNSKNKDVMSEIACATAALVKDEVHTKEAKRTIRKHSQVIQKNSITRSFFIALHLCNLLKTLNEKGFISQIENQPVLSSITNDLFVDLCFSVFKPKDLENISFCLGMIIKDEKNNALVVAQAAHMLARISNPENGSLSDKGIKKVLIDRWNTLHNKYFDNNILKVNDFTAFDSLYSELVLFRTISVSLLIYGCKDDNEDYEDDFLECILQNDLFNSLNRGFHIAYFDEQFADKKNNRYLDDTKQQLRVSSTLSFLFQSVFEEADLHLKQQNGYVEDCINPLISLNALTILTICQSRSDTDIMDRYGENLRILLKYITKSWIPVTDSVKQYAKTFFIDDDDKFDSQKCERLYHDILLDIFTLKMERMKGWSSNKNKVDTENFAPCQGKLSIRSESVSDHIYGSYLLGRLFLPNSLYNWTQNRALIRKYSKDGYDKETILRMLLIHDFGKCKSGDQVYCNQTKDYQEKQDAAISRYKFTRSARGIYGFDTLCRDWDVYKSNSSINALIAKEINCIEMYVTAHMYAEQGGQIDIYEWEKYIEDEKQVSSEMGKNILELVRRGVFFTEE